jgi:prephenate dehydrogenase
MKNFADSVICIVGLGLMGGSAARRVHGQCKKLIGIELNKANTDLALREGWIDESYCSIAAMQEAPDMVILCSPVRAIQTILENEIMALTSPCVVIDFGSTKDTIIKIMDTLPERFTCFACHPMCGKETSGPEASQQDLFLGQLFLVHPIGHARFEDPLLTALISILGGYPMVMNPESHDLQMAYISHVPYLIAAALILVSANDQRENPEDLWKIAANGFHDTTRLAGSDITMMSDILITNRDPIVDVLKKLTDQIHEIQAVVERGQSHEIVLMLEQVKNLKKRANLCRR